MLSYCDSKTLYGLFSCILLSGTVKVICEFPLVGHLGYCVGGSDMKHDRIY